MTSGRETGIIIVMQRLLLLFLAMLIASVPTAVAALPCLPVAAVAAAADDCMSNAMSKRDMPIQSCAERCAAMIGVPAVVPLAPQIAVRIAGAVDVAPNLAAPLREALPPRDIRPPRTIA